MLFSVRAFLSLLAALVFAIVACAQPLNDNFANRIPVEPGVPFDGCAADATFEPLDPFPAYIPDAYGSVWWTWEPQMTGFAAIIDTKNPSVIFDDVLAVYQGDDLATLRDPTWMYISPIYGAPIGIKAFLGFPTTAGTPVSIGMAGRAWGTLNHSFLLTFSDTPIIIEAPASQTNYAGGAVTFRFTSPSYRFGHTQWQFNSQDIPNATNAVLLVSDLRPSDAGEYRVVIEATNSAGVLKRTISPAATLTVLGDVIPPTLSFQRAPDSASDFLLNIFGTTNQWYSIDRTSDFKKWSRVKTQYRADTVANGPTPIAQMAPEEFLRVEHRGNLPEVCTQQLRQMHFAKELLRISNHILPGAIINPDDLKQFLGELPRCPQDADYSCNPMDTAPSCPWGGGRGGHDAYSGIFHP